MSAHKTLNLFTKQPNPFRLRPSQRYKISSKKPEQCNLAYLQETFLQSFFCDVQDLRLIYTAIVINLPDHQAVGEGRDIQHVQQSGFTGSHLVTNLDEIYIVLWEDN